MGKLRPGENRVFPEGDMARSSRTEIPTLVHLTPISVLSSLLAIDYRGIESFGKDKN